MLSSDDERREHIETYGYLWGQDEENLHVFIFTPYSATAKQIKCTIHRTRFSFRTVGGEVSIEGAFSQNVVAADCTWMFHCPGIVYVELTKEDRSEDNRWWNSVFDGHPEVDAAGHEDNTGDIEFSKLWVFVGEGMCRRGEANANW